MMRCSQAKQLFDAYLDGELSPAMATELGAHRLKCPSCRRELALLEVTGHIIRSDEESAELPGDFTDRLLQCVETPRQRRLARLRMSLFVGGPLAAAAVITLAFIGFFDGQGESKVAGFKEINPNAVPAQSPVVREPAVEIQSDEALQEFLNGAQRNVDTARRSGESLQGMLDSTFLDVLEVLEEADRQQEPAETPDASAAPRSDSDAPQ